MCGSIILPSAWGIIEAVAHAQRAVRRVMIDPNQSIAGWTHPLASSKLRTLMGAAG